MNYVVGSVLSYFLNKHFTFEVREYSASQVLRFIVNIAVCYAVAYGPVSYTHLGDAGAGPHRRHGRALRRVHRRADGL